VKHHLANARSKVGAEPEASERIVSVNQGSLAPSLMDGDAPLEAGTVLISDKRLVHLGPDVTEMPLDAIDDIRPAGRRLLIDTGDGAAVLVDAPDPGRLTALINRLRNPQGR
jgi:hypothetical protein